MGDIQADPTATQNLVTIEFADGYDVIMGPPGARGMSETGKRIEPPGPLPSVDARLRDSIRATAVQSGLTWREEHHKKRLEVGRFDFGTVTSINDWLFAAGGGAAALGVIRGCHTLILEWLKGRAGRSVTVKIPGRGEITVKGDNDIKRALEQLDQFNASIDDKSASRSVSSPRARKQPKKAKPHSKRAGARKQPSKGKSQTNRAGPKK